MDPKRLFVTGAAGMLGSSFYGIVPRNTTVFYTDIRQNNAYDIQYLDVRDYDVFLSAARDARPTHLFHFAAETSLERCEEDPDLAWSTNALGTQNAALIARLLNIPLVYVSTAGVFDGNSTQPYTEFDEPKPIMVYGRSKLEGERIAQRLLPLTYIVRAGWMPGGLALEPAEGLPPEVGGLDREHKFVALIARQLQAGTKTLHAVDDKFGTPTYAPHFAAKLIELTDTGLFGTYHLACKGGGSRFDVANYIVKSLGFADSVRVLPVSSSHFSAEYFAPRPKSEMLRNFILELRGQNSMPTWQEALEEYLSLPYFSALKRGLRSEG